MSDPEEQNVASNTNSSGTTDIPASIGDVPPQADESYDSTRDDADVANLVERDPDDVNDSIGPQGDDSVSTYEDSAEIDPNLDEIDLLSADMWFLDCGCTVDDVCLTEAHDAIDDNDEEQSEEEPHEPEDEADSEDDGINENDTPDGTNNFLRVVALDFADEEDLEDTSNSAAQDRSDDEDSTCFVATAAFRDTCHPDVVFLRRFRDDFLVTTKAGRRFIRLYWVLGPKLARPVKKIDFLAYIFRKLISAITAFIRVFWNPGT
ncbi:CFI-box-CTERM domain-containing protein [Roseibaca sp. Y0-43]|uniref:CFI-box-CTERM domain-containing protein n=1 Tax=Roseibaca sp. Y0-43 TaxID=2816854 RepID=UPI001D0C1CAB|nr:CFI-box-CTERM domain-containing protein [Roseibaca sp. Y0-43]MCC1482849.1 hypothetical protein [Roseibaca sp. Y0-43]